MRQNAFAHQRNSLQCFYIIDTPNFSQNHKIKEIDKYAITAEEQRIWKQQQIYCSQQHISQTPSIIIDGYYVPEFYQLKELKYVLT